MNKNFTHTFINYLSKTLLVCVIVVCSSFKSTDITNSFNRDIQAKTIKCYPNPAISFVNFEFPANFVSKNYSLQVYSFTGKKMHEAIVNSPKATLTFTNQFYRGLYVYQLQDKSGKIFETGKFQVNR